MSEVKFRKGTVSKRADRIKSFISPCAGSFSSLVQLSSIFVDKTLLIQDFYQGRNTHILLTLPRCMGKTTALTMCADFFSNLDTDINRQTFQTAPTLIMNEEAFVKENMGAWPTIMFSLKYVVGKTKEAVLDSLRVQLAAQFERHEYLHEWLEKDKGIASKHKANVYLKYCKMDINEAEAIRGLQVLINHLHNHYKKRVILFVDDYDVPWTWSSDLRSQTESDQVHTFIYQFLLMTFSEQDRCIHRSIVAGSYRVASEQFDNNRLNLKHLTAIGNPLAKYFGFIEEEFHALCESYKVSPEHREVAKAYYNGLPIFHPNSTVEFLNDYEDNGINAIKSNFVETIHTSLLSKLFQIPPLAAKIREMMPTGSSITMKTRSVFGADEYKTLSQLASNFGESTKLNRTEDLISSFISFLFSSGLLACEYDPSGIQKFKIPNAEVREVFFRRLEPYYHQIYAIDVVYFDKVTDEIAKLLETPDNSNLQHAFQQLVNQMPNFSSFHESSDPGIHPNEHSIHFPIDFVVLRLSIVDKMGFDFTLTGISQNRPDVAFMTKARDVAVILEMKFGNGDVDKGLEQVGTQRYLDSLSRHETIKKILVRSIHVAENKNVTIKGRDMERGKLDLKTFLKQSHDELHPPPGKRMTRSQNTQTAVEKPLSGNETFNSYDSNKAFEVLDHDMPVYPSPDQRTASDYAETGSQTDDLVQSWETVEYKCCTLKRSLDDSLAENDCESSQLSSQKSTTTMDRGVQVLSDSFIMQLNMTAYKGQKGANDGFAKTRIYGSWETMDESATSTLCLEDTVVSNDCESLQLCAQNLVPNDVGQVLDVRKEELHHCLSPDQLKISVIGGRAVDALNTSADSSWCLVEGVNDTSTHSTENSLAGNDQESAQLCAQISEVVDEVVVLSKEDQLCLLPDRVEASARGGRAHNLLENSLDCRVESSQDVDGVINLARDDLENLQSSQADSIDAVVVDQIGSQVIEGVVENLSESMSFLKDKEQCDRCPIAHRQGSPNTGLQENGVAHLAGHLVHVAPDSISATDSLVIEAIDYFLQRLTFYEKIYGMGPLPVDYERLLPNVLLEVKEKFCNRDTSLIHFAESEQVCNAMLQGEAWWTDFLTWLESYVSFNDLVLQARQYWREVATKELENKEQQVVRPETSCAAVKYQDDFLAAVDPYPTVCSHCVAKKIQKREKQRSRLSFLPARLINRAIPQLSPLLPAAMDKQIKEKMEAEASDRRAWSMKEEERWRRMKSKAEPTHGYEHPEKAGQEGYSSASWRKEGADDDYQEKMRRDEEYYKDQTEKENLYWENRAREKEEREEEERCRERRLEEVEARQKEEREREDAAREREARQEEQRIREQSIRDDESVFYDHDPNNNSGKM